jgi:hypothetical protein
VNKAKELRHPVDSAMGNISETLSLGPEAFTGHRFMQDLKQDELKLHRTFSREVEAICQGKRSCCGASSAS